MHNLTREVGGNLIRVKPAGGNKMKSLIVIAVLLMGFTALVSPQASYAQAAAGTMDDCIEAFDDLLAAWRSETDIEDRTVVCKVSSGKARVALGGYIVSDTEPRLGRVAAARLIRSGKNKECNIVFFRQEDSPAMTEIGRFNIPGRHASAWNRFLKGPGCQEAMALMP